MLCIFLVMLYSKMDLLYKVHNHNMLYNILYSMLYNTLCSVSVI